MALWTRQGRVTKTNSGVNFPVMVFSPTRAPMIGKRFAAHLGRWGDEALLDDLAEYIDRQYLSLGKPRDQRLILALLRRLAGGKPVPTEDVAVTMGIPANQARATIDSLPNSWVNMSKDGQITGMGGLDLNPTRHKVVIDGHTLYAWCAFDCLFLPGVLGQPLEAESACPVSGDVVRLRITPTAVESATPATALMSFVTPTNEALRQDLRQVFCSRVNFFTSAPAAATWQSANPEAVIISLDDGHALGRRRNTALFADALAG